MFLIEKLEQIYREEGKALYSLDNHHVIKYVLENAGFRCSPPYMVNLQP